MKRHTLIDLSMRVGGISTKNFYCFALFFLSSCIYKTKDDNKLNIESNIVTDSLAQSELNPTINKNSVSITENDELTDVEIQRRIRIQLNSYQTAYLNGNVDSILFYVYPMEEFAKEKYPDEDINMKNIIIKSLNDMDNLKKTSGVIFKYNIKESKFITQDQNFIFYLIKAELTAENKIKKKVIPETLIGISKTRGRTWKFMSMSGDDRDFIKSEFGTENLEKILEATNKSLVSDKN